MSIFFIVLIFASANGLITKDLLIDLNKIGVGSVKKIVNDVKEKLGCLGSAKIERCNIFFLPRENIMRFHNDFDMMKDPDQSNVEARIVICAQWVHPFTQTLYIRSGYI